MNQQPVLLYVNEKQKQFLKANQKTRVWLGGRGTGKSTTIGFSTRQKANALPRGKGFFASTTYNQILTKTLPAIEQVWQRMGMIEGVHYVIGRKPPKYFETPIAPPRSYKNVISFMNGFCVDMLSMDRADLARGGSYDTGEIDECALIDGEDYRKILIPSIRGNAHHFSHHLHGNVSMYTSIPWNPKGYWIYDLEERAKQKPQSYFWIESTAYDNIHILTAEGIERMKDEMTYLEFQIEVMNERINRIEGGFYSAFSATHIYQPRYAYDDNEEDWRQTKITQIDNQYKDTEVLDLSFDFSGWFNCLWVIQERGDYAYAVDSLFVKGEEKLPDLISKFCEQYKTHKYKLVRIWGEPRGHDRQPATGSLFESIQDKFTSLGWECEIWAPAGHSWNHADRYEFMHNLMLEQNEDLPKLRVNAETCKAPIIAIQTTDVTVDFKKVKTAEKNRQFPQEHAPHFTDALDYYFVAKHGFKTLGYYQNTPAMAGFF
jgi:hypothetical protein